MNKFLPVFSAVAAVGLMTATSAFAGSPSSFTVTADYAQGTSTYPGASTFATSSTFIGYTGSVTIPSVATISGGELNPGGSTTPGYNFENISPYVAAEVGSPETISFNSNQKYFGLLWGTVDPDNEVQLYEGSTLLATYTGAGLASSIGLQSWPKSGSYVGFLANNSSSDFNKVVLSANTASLPFETSNFSAVSAAPEPSAWALMLLGIGAVGVAMRGSKRKPASALASA